MPEIKPSIIVNYTNMTPSNRPSDSGWWLYRPDAGADYRPVLVENKPASGMHCRTLRMGGSPMCGFADWSGEWL